MLTRVLVAKWLGCAPADIRRCTNAELGAALWLMDDQARREAEHG